MHELGYACEIVTTLEEYMKEQNLTDIESVTLTVGEATGVVPRFMYDCWPAATENTKLKNTKLKINFVRVVGACHNCDCEFVVSDYHGKCPKCGCEDYSMENGYEFEITEIVAK